MQRERSRSPLNLVVSPASRRSTDSAEPRSPPAVGDHAAGPGGTGATAGAGVGGAAAGAAAPPAAASTKARLHDFFCVTDTSAGALEVCTTGWDGLQGVGPLSLKVHYNQGPQ